MNFKFHNYALLLTAIIFAPVSAQENQSQFDNAALGKCYSSSDAFVRDTLGEQASTDSNIRITEKDSWTWVTDATASTNYTWYLLKKQNHKTCFDVFIPSASSVEFKTKSGSPVIEATIAALPDLPAKLIEFHIDPVTRIFKPEVCFILKYDEAHKTVESQHADCKNILE